MDIVAASGMVRVTVAPKPGWLAMLVEAIGIAILCLFMIRGWASTSPWLRGLLVWAVGAAVVAWFYQLSGSEVIEFDAQRLVITKQVLGWNRRSEYPIAECRELQWRDQSDDGGNFGLRCKVGWRTIKFGECISEDESIDVLTALQANLPEVANQTCAMPDSQHFTTLNLS